VSGAPDDHAGLDRARQRNHLEQLVAQGAEDGECPRALERGVAPRQIGVDPLQVLSKRLQVVMIVVAALGLPACPVDQRADLGRPRGRGGEPLGIEIEVQRHDGVRRVDVDEAARRQLFEDAGIRDVLCLGPIFAKSIYYYAGIPLGTALQFTRPLYAELLRGSTISLIIAGAFAAAGEKCVGGACARGLRCAGNRCAEPKPEGAACKNDYECRGGCLPAKQVCGMRCDVR